MATTNMGNSSDHISGRQISAARALLGLTQARLAEVADVSRTTVKNLEATSRVGRASHGRLRAALEGAGVRFFFNDEWGGEGVRLLGNKKET